MEQLPSIRPLFHAEEPTPTHALISLDPPDILPPQQGEGSSTPSAIKTFEAITGYSFPREAIHPSSLEEIFTNPKKMSLDDAISLFLTAPLLNLVG